MPMTEEEVFEKVREILMDSLAVDEDEVTRGAKLRTDLGAESIDFLEIVFKLEKAFDIKIPRGELLPDNVVNNPEYVQDGKLTDTGLSELKKRMAHADFSEFEKDPDVNKIWDMFTTQTIMNFVLQKINGT
ncbi:MAG TPA: acyl carrier protein [Phycisphaerae bacterium]|nr:acyl carrier protein [Phycisphaerae bacterium]